MSLQINLTSVPIQNLDAALDFYTNKLGFVKKTDIPMGDTRYLTVVSQDNPNGTELMLEPCGALPEVKTFKEWLYSRGTPFAAFQVDDCHAEHKRLSDKGVEFKSEPMDVGTAIIATLDDTCGNLIMIYQDTSG